MAEIDRYYERSSTTSSRPGGSTPASTRTRPLSQPHRSAPPDPHVERLVEAFAFLSATSVRKLDDDFPELTHSLLELFWPYHLRPIPSMALLEFSRSRGRCRSGRCSPGASSPTRARSPRQAG